MENYDAAVSLENAAYSPRRLMAIHYSVTALYMLLCSLVSVGLGAVDVKGGLDTITVSTFLTTAQLVLPLAGIVLIPGWTAGLWTVSLGIARGQQMTPRNLTDGFQRLLPLFGAVLLLGLQFVFRGYISIMITMWLLPFVPVGAKFYEVAVQGGELSADALAAQLGADYGQVMATVYILFAVVFALVCLPVYYRYRMTGYLIVDRQESGGGRAMLRSRLMMFRRRWELAKLDLRFWWYYLLLMTGTVISCGGAIVHVLSISLPIAFNTVYWICLAVGTLMVLGVQILAGPRVAVTYALRYEQYLQTPPPPPPEPKKQPEVDPQDLPWQY